MTRWLLLPLLLVTTMTRRAGAEIAASADLNCDFSSSCRWRNGTNGQEDGADFVAGQNLQMDEFHKITALRHDQDDYFVYTYALGGRQEATLVSDVVNCQLGGGNIKFWYWKTGHDVLLDVCVRQPPGNRDRAALKCYDGLSSTFAQQWIFRAIELPPISQPFELIFRATFTAPLDILALDSIQYDASLCGNSHRQKRAVATAALQVMSLNEWMALKPTMEAEPPEARPVLLIVGDHVPEAEIITTTTSTPPPSSSTSSPSPFPTLVTETTSETNSTPKEETTTVPAENVDQMENVVKFLRQVQPALPYIPTLIRSLQSIDPRVAKATGTDPLVELNELSKIVGIDLVETASEIRRASGQPTNLVDQSGNVVTFPPLPPVDHRYEGVFRHEQAGVAIRPYEPPPPPPPARSNIFGLERASRPPQLNPSTVYPPRLVKSLKTTVHRELPEEQNYLGEETMDLSHLSTDEIKALEQFHHKIFHSKYEAPVPTRQPVFTEGTTMATPLVVFQKKHRAPPVTAAPVIDVGAVMESKGGATSVSDLIMGHMDDLKSILPPDALDDLTKLREIPDLDELTKGMDVGLINQPGGFAKLKKDFMQRMIRRSLGLSPSMPKSSNGGASEGAGGHFDGPNNEAVGTLGSYANTDPAVATSNSIDSRPIAAPPPPPPPPPGSSSSFGGGFKAQGERNFQPAFTPRRGAQFDSLCPALDCNFDANSFCRYVTSTTDSDLILALPSNGKQREFALSSAKVSNTLTGVPSDLMKQGYFAYAANAEHASDQFVLSSSAPVNVPSAARIDFFVYLAGVHGRLRVCVDTLTNCPFEVNGRDLDLNARQWRNFHVPLPEGAHAIHFVADRLRKNYAIGMDNIQLLNRYGMASLACR